MDYLSGFTYIHLQTSTNAEETLKAKRAFQIYSESLGVKILYYHTDNGRFADEGFTPAIEIEVQTISFLRR